jgi:hypothetical protein
MGRRWGTVRLHERLECRAVASRVAVLDPAQRQLVDQLARFEIRVPLDVSDQRSSPADA